MYEQRANAYNNRVRYLSGNGAIGPEEAAIIEEERQELTDIRLDLELTYQELERLRSSNLRRTEAVHTQEVAVENRIDDFKATYPPIPFQKAEHIRGSLIHEINIYAVSDMQELHRALLHEMGPALDLEHSDSNESIMAAEHEIGSGTTNVTAEDVAAALSRCSTDQEKSF